MSEHWKTIPVDDVRVGHHVRYAGQEFTVARVDSAFLGREQMVCLIEDTPERWHAYPAMLGNEIEVSEGS